MGRSGASWEGLTRVYLQTGPPGTTRETKRFLGLVLVQESVETVARSTAPLRDSRASLDCHHEVFSRKTTLRGGRVVEDVQRETVVVRDHLERVHSARVTVRHAGQLATETAALYLPAGLAASALSGTLAASMAASMGARSGGGTPPPGKAGGRAGSNGKPADCAVVGYRYEGGSMRWGVLSDPAALGLPRQRAVTRASLDRVRPPPWQPPHVRTPTRGRAERRPATPLPQQREDWLAEQPAGLAVGKPPPQQQPPPLPPERSLARRTPLLD